MPPGFPGPPPPGMFPPGGFPGGPPPMLPPPTFVPQQNAGSPYPGPPFGAGSPAGPPPPGNFPPPTMAAAPQAVQAPRKTAPTLPDPSRKQTNPPFKKETDLKYSDANFSPVRAFLLPDNPDMSVVSIFIWLLTIHFLLFLLFALLLKLF